MTALERLSTTLKGRKRRFSAPFNKGSKACGLKTWRVEDVHPTTIQRWGDRDCVQAQAADKKVITGVSTENVELDELHSFAGAKHPDDQEADLDEVGQHWTHVAMARESRLMLEVVLGPRTQE